MTIVQFVLGHGCRAVFKALSSLLSILVLRGLNVRFQPVYLRHLNDTEGIYEAAIASLHAVSLKEGDKLVTLNLSPGTPVMAFVWAFAALRHPQLKKRLIASPNFKKPPETIALPRMDGVARKTNQYFGKGLRPIRRRLSSVRRKKNAESARRNPVFEQETCVFEFATVSRRSHETIRRKCGLQRGRGRPVRSRKCQNDHSDHSRQNALRYSRGVQPHGRHQT